MANKENSHSLAQILQADEFIIYTDLIKTLFDPNKLYTKTEIQKGIDEFLEQEVK